jgi:hypothetical protein
MRYEPLLCSLSAALVLACSSKLQVGDETETVATEDAGAGGAAGTSILPVPETPSEPASPAAPSEPAAPATPSELAPPDAPRQLLPVTSDSPAECPATTPHGVCGTEGLLCAYRGEVDGSHYYHECACFAASSTEFWWTCYNERSGDGPDPCPLTEPDPTDSCWGARGVQCSYLPRETCGCSTEAEDPLWECGSRERNDYVPGPIVLPATVDTATPVSSMSDAERQAWCQWYVIDVNHRVDGSPEPAVDADGYLVDVGWCRVGSDFYALGMLPSVSVAHCVQNLALSTCSLPVSELTDCTVTVLNRWPSPRGCARYLEDPSCAGTIVVPNAYALDPTLDVAEEDSLCTLRVQ